MVFTLSGMYLNILKTYIHKENYKAKDISMMFGHSIQIEN